MQLTQFTDYSLRVLLYLGAHHEETVSVTDIARAYGISHHHLVKVVQNLARHGFVSTTRGRGGGARLAQSPSAIGIGEVIRKTEPDLDLLECFDPKTSHCPITNTCALQALLTRAQREFMAVLDSKTLADLLHSKAQMQALWQIGRPHPP